MLVPVQMGGMDPGFDDPFNLGCEFTTYGLLGHGTGDDPREEGCVPGHEPSLGSYEPTEALRVGQRPFLHERQVDTHVQLRVPPAEFQGVVERVSRGRKRGASHDALPVCPLDAAVDVEVEAQIVGVHHQQALGTTGHSGVAHR